MDESERLIKDWFQQRLTEWPDWSPLHEEAAQLAHGTIDPAERSRLESVRAFEAGSGLRGNELDLIVAFIRQAFENRVGMSILSSAAAHLKRYFGVAEGEFIRLRPNEIAQLIAERLDAILEDGMVDRSEELDQVELQRFFDLSYDDYLALGRPAIERAYTDLEFGVTSRLTDSPARRRAKLTLLTPLYRLATSRHRTPGALY
jgi:hypothetical protein